MQPLLSICIPTYNRGYAIKQSLESYVSCDGFDETVEIVISDNASTDDTQEIVESFCKKYSNIKYYRNETNLQDRNFEIALRRGTGQYLKLQNDVTLYYPYTLEYIKKGILDNKEKKPMFFTNDFLFTKYRGMEYIEANSFEEYVGVISTFVTAIHCFGIWKYQLEEIDLNSDRSDLMLNQVDWAYKLMEKYGKCIFHNKRYYEGIPKHNGGYNWFKVHLENYYETLLPYARKGLISKKGIKQDKRNLMYHFVNELEETYIVKDSKWDYDRTGTFNRFFKYYKGESFFYALIMLWPIYYIVYNYIPRYRDLIRRVIVKAILVG